jgi:hypothetical protein
MLQLLIERMQPLLTVAKGFDDFYWDQFGLPSIPNIYKLDKLAEIRLCLPLSQPKIIPKGGNHPTVRGEQLIPRRRRPLPATWS